MEKLPFGERPEPRTVGRGSENAKEAARKAIIERFGKGHLQQFTEKQLEKLRLEEREKTPEEKEAVRVANEITNRILRKLGLPEFDVPQTNVHFVSQKFWDERFSKETDVPSMVAAPKRQAIFVNGDYKPEARVSKALAMLHEFVHLKGHLSVEVDSEESKDLYRSGLVTYPTHKKSDKSGYTAWFDGLNEAVVTEIEMRCADQALRENEFLQDEADWLNSPEAKKLKEEYARERRIDSSEIEWISRDGKKMYLQSYRKQRRVLNYVVDQIYADGGFRSRDDVMRFFFAAHFKSSLLPIGRLVEKTFGKGAFRELGNMDAQEGSASAGRVLDGLMKRRNRLLKK